MTTSALVLIISMLVLGGGIAALGDRIGTRVGKARLSLFNLRPRQTAVLVTLLTGVTISASTLAILFASSAQLRTGIFELEQIQKRLGAAREDLEKTSKQKERVEKELTETLAQKETVESELAKTKAEKDDAQKRLDATNKSLKISLARQAMAAKQIAVLTNDLRQLLVEREELIKQRDRVKAEIAQLKNQNSQLRGQNSQLKSENSQLQASNRNLQASNNQLQERNSQLQGRNVELEKQLSVQTLQIAEKTKQISEQTQKLDAQKQQLEEQERQIARQEKERVFLQQEVATLEQYYRSYQLLREREVSLVRGQLLASGVVRILNPNAARQAVDQLLSEANRNAIEANQLNISSSDRVVQITQAEVEQLIDKIKDGKDYVIRILSAGNYVKGEKQVQVFADALSNEIVFRAGESIGATYVSPATMSAQELRQRIEFLLGETQLRARRAGILSASVQIGDGRITTYITFLEQLRQHKEAVDVRAVVVEDTYTAAPLKINLVAVENGRVVFSTL